MYVCSRGNAKRDDHGARAQEFSHILNSRRLKIKIAGNINNSRRFGVNCPSGLFYRDQG